MSFFSASIFRKLDSRWFVGAFFALYFLIGLSSFRSFGIAVDEGTMDTLGRDVYRYVFLGTDWPTNPAWRFHGTIVELPIHIVQQLLSPGESPHHEYIHIFTEHFMTFVFTFFGVVMLYLLARGFFKNSWWALLCCLLFVLTPRLFAQSFYNSRDLPMLALFTASMLTLRRFSIRPTVFSALLHGLCSALTLALRMPALIIPALTIALFVLQALARKDGHGSSAYFRNSVLLILYLMVLCYCTVLFWPFLWEEPLTHFLDAYRYMSQINGSTVFLGSTYPRMPWFYIPVWIAASVPVCYTLFFLVGCCSLLLSLAMRPCYFFAHRSEEVLFLGWFFLPILSIILTGAGIYNEWRHIFFVYPAFLLLSVIGIRLCLAWAFVLRGLHVKIVVSVIVAAIGGQMLSTGLWMVRNHPLQFAYFSLPARMVSGLIPYDYWKLSYREAMQFVLEREPGMVSVYSNANVAFMNAYNIFPDSLERMVRVWDIPQAMYVVTDDPAIASGLPLLHSVSVDGLFLCGVYQGPARAVSRELIEARPTGPQGVIDNL